jgi:hypothetical protein
MARRSVTPASENTTRAMLYVSMTRGRDTNTAYLHERSTSEGQPNQPNAVHILRRGTSKQAAELARALIANHDQRSRTAHDVAADAADASALPDRVRSVLRRRGVAIQQRHKTYQQ